jgi:hypothetical protein
MHPRDRAAQAPDPAMLVVANRQLRQADRVTGPLASYRLRIASRSRPFHPFQSPGRAGHERNESPWVFAAVANNIWTFGGPTGGNQLFLNPSVNHHFGDGWSVGSSPEITTNLITSGGKWTVRVGGGFGKLVI